MANRIIQIAYPADKFQDLVLGLAWSVGAKFTDVNTQTLELSGIGQRFPSLKNHASYNIERDSVKITALELVHSAVPTILAMQAQQGNASRRAEEAQQAELAATRTLLESGGVSLSVIDEGAV